MIERTTYEFTAPNGKTYRAVGVVTADTIYDRTPVAQLRVSAVCDALGMNAEELAAKYPMLDRAIFTPSKNGKGDWTKAGFTWTECRRETE